MLVSVKGLAGWIWWRLYIDEPERQNCNRTHKNTKITMIQNYHTQKRQSCFFGTLYLVWSAASCRDLLSFSLDCVYWWQIIAYLLISASSSAAIRVDDWQSNWGKDKFPDMATASVSMSFLGFVALAFNALISGYALCTSKPV